MSAAPGVPPTSLPDLVDEITRRMESGERLDLSALTDANPEHADELKRLIPALRMLADWSGSINGAAVGSLDIGGVTGTLGDFRIIRPLGRGGMGVVYEAEQISLGRRVALKALPSASTMDPKQLQRFQNEARSAASLHHSNIVPVYAVGCERGVHYFAMQFIEGPTLADVIRGVRAPADVEPPDEASTLVGRRSTMGDPKAARDFRKAARIGIQAAQALEHAHAVGIVHRDIKPGNLLLDSRGDVWVADFGLARSRGCNLTTTGDLIGTLRYMSPEQATAHHDLVDHRTDIYSLGASLYELLTLRPAIEGDDTAAMMRRIVHDDPKPLRAVNPAIPTALETIVLKAMAKEPAHRFATAEEFADDLRRFLDDVPIRAKRPTAMQRVGRWTRRHRTATRSAAASLLAISLAAAAAFALSRERIQKSLDSEVAANKELAESLEREREVQSRLRIALARSAWSGNRLDEARRRLEECPPEHRDSEWHKLYDLATSLVTTIKIPDQAFCLSSDDRRFAYFSNGAVSVCDLASGELIRAFPVAPPVTSMVFSEDGQRIAMLQARSPNPDRALGLPAPRTGSIAVWDWFNSRSLLFRELQINGFSHALSPYGDRYSSNRVGKTSVYETMSGTPAAEFDNPLNTNTLRFSNIVFCRNRTLMGAFQAKSVMLWNTENPEAARRIETASLLERISAFSDDGTRMLATGTRPAENEQRPVNFLKLLELPSLRHLFEVESADPIAAAAISRDAARIAYIVLDRVELIDAADGRSLATLRGHNGSIQTVRFSSDGSRLYTTARDNTLRVWNIAPWKAPAR